MPRGNKIIIRSGTTAPTASDFVAGEPAWDKTNGKFYVKNAAGTMVEIGAGGGGATQVYEYATTASFPNPGTTATLTIDKSTNRIYRWTGSEYAEVGSLTTDSSLWTYFQPPAPTGVSATAGNAQATVSWTAPTVLSQLPITDYVVQYSTDGSTWTTFADGTSTATSATVTSLTNGTAYVFRAAGVNAAGTGSYSSASSSVTPAAGDAQFSSVALLLNMEGSGATLTDLSSYARTVTAVGSATQSTAQFKYGAKSLLLSSGDNYLTTSGSQFSVGTGDYTVEAWVYSTGGSGAFRHVFDTRTSDATGFSLGFDDSNRVFLFSNNAFRVQAGSVSLNQWYHLAVCRASGVTRVFLSGTQVGSDWSNTFNYAETTLLIGRYYSSAIYQWFGHIDEVRWTNAARYTTTFTPPTSAFPLY